MSAIGNETPWRVLGRLLAEGKSDEIHVFVSSLLPAETALTVSRLNEVERVKLLSILSPDDAAEVLVDLSDTQAADLIEEIPPQDAAGIVDVLPADKQADLLGDMNESDADAILDAMPPEDAEITRGLLGYPPDTAGGIMSTEFLTFRDNTTAGDVLEDLSKNRSRYLDYEVQYAFVTDAEDHLVGVLKMRDLLLAARNEPIRSMMNADPIRVSVTDSLDSLEQLFSEHGFLGVPACDENGRIAGMVQRSAVIAATGEKAKDSYLKSLGIVGGEEFRSMPFLQRSMRRLSWLGPNIVLNIIAASVIALFQDTLQAVIALAVFLPIISDMSGCSGNQAVAVSIRELTLGLLKPREYLRVLLKESAMGIVNGIVLGFLLGGAALLWQGNPYLGLVVGVALAVNTLVSVCLGGVVPLLLQRLRVDPALASGPILTTATDMFGFFVVLSLATAMLANL